ncbi:MAG: hypothetical protein H6Q72_2411 [Firmicutes bacterium]|nr:hypothetical protein [Bacillota bacterium]
MMATAEVSTAANVLGLSEEVITNFLYLVNSLGKSPAIKNVAPVENTSYYNTADALEALMNEYAAKL